MPKETVHGVDGAYDIQVGWAADRHVQLGVETSHGHSLMSMLYGDQHCLERIGRAARAAGWKTQEALDSDSEKEMLRRVGRDVLDMVEGEYIPDPNGDPLGRTGYTGVWSTLDRARINRLIRSLRKARDAAFGRDE